MMRVSDPRWPEPLAKEAFHGLAGVLVRIIDPHTEADPAAVLLQFLVAFGNVIGSGPHFRAEADLHALNLFVALVGDTSKGRKGVSLGHAKRLVSVSDPEWAKSHIQTGLNSGEGLIHAVRDPTADDPGIDDKRLLVVEPELASTLRVMGRHGNTVSPVLRLAWDDGNLQVLTKNSPEKATGAHVSVIAHVTKDELRHELTRIDAANGFGNRFLWSMVRRSKALPDGGCVSEADLQPLQERLHTAVESARSDPHELRRDKDANGVWHAIYEELSEGKAGLFGAITARAEAQVMRLACIYALLDCSPEIRCEHLRAALAVWNYCESSARYIFGDATGNPLADELLSQLRRAAPAGLTRTEISNALGRNREREDIGAALNLLAQYGHAQSRKEATTGRPAERWFAVE